MKYDNKLQEDIAEYFQNRGDMYYHGYTGTHFFRTWKLGEDKHIIHSKKPHGDKNMISASINIYSNAYEDNSKYGVEIKIEMYMWGYQSDETVFQGWVESIEDLEIILKAVGL